MQNDVRLLSQAIDVYAKGFFSQWGINVHNSMSLPGVAQKLAYKYYEKDAVPIYSFGEKFKHVSQDIRSQLYGGCTMVFHRMIDLRPGSVSYPKNAYQSENGKRYKRMTFLDFNSLYPKALSQSLPCGPGLLYSQKGNFFHIKSMHTSEKTSSLMCAEWLEVII